MKRKYLQLVLLTVTIISLVLLVGIQISWVLKSARMQEAQFNHTVTLAMNRIIENLSRNQDFCEEMNNCLQAGKMHSCAMLMQNRMEWADLDSLIKEDLKYYNIRLSYEFDIVARGTDVATSSKRETYINDNLDAILNQSGYELHLRFPDKNEFIKAQIGYIFISSIALLILVSVSFILIYKFYKREKKLTGNITDFINNITHEFKTPLTNIALANSMISKHKNIEKDEKLSSYTAIIRDEHQRLREKVRLLLKTTMPDTGQYVNNEQFNAADEIRTVAAIYSVQIKEKNGSITVNSKGSNFILTGSVEMFQIAIGNLIDNAIRYNRNAPFIDINLESGEEMLKISITDNGMGIGSEYADRIFEKYYRIPTGDIHENEGFGLGLYYVRNTVRQMNGRIRVSSRVKKGTTFILEFPLIVG